MSLVIKPYSIGCQPSPSLPAETVIADGYSTYLLFFSVSEAVTESGYLKDLGVAIVECKSCVISKFGYPNDEGYPEHPLNDYGLNDIDSAVIEVIESVWVKEISAQMEASSRRIWGPRGTMQGVNQNFKGRHFIVPLKEKTFECIASELIVVRYAKNFQEAHDYVFSKINEH